MKKLFLILALGLSLQACFLDDLIGEGKDDDQHEEPAPIVRPGVITPYRAK